MAKKKKKAKNYYNDLQNTTQKTKGWATRIRVTSSAPEGKLFLLP